MYNCLIQGQLDYCCEVWGSRYDVHANRLEILQKRAARMILNANFYTPSSEIFKRLNLLPFQKRLKKAMYIIIITSVARGGGGGGGAGGNFRRFVGTFGNLSVHVSRQACHLYRQNV